MANRLDVVELAEIARLISREVTGNRVDTFNSLKKFAFIEHCQNAVCREAFIAVFPHIDINCVFTWFDICIITIENVLVVDVIDVATCI